MSISKRVRFEIFKRDKFICRYCGKRPPEVVLEADHIVPVCEGGTDDLHNLVTSCFACNRGKAGVSLGEAAPLLDDESVLEAIQEVLEKKILLKQSIRSATAYRKAEREAARRVRTWWAESFDFDLDITESSLCVFVAKLEMVEILDAIRTAARAFESGHVPESRIQRYFCGILWKIIRSRNERTDESEQ
jgi:hypothetical protein